MSEEGQTYSSTFSMEDIEPFELPNSSNEELDTEMIEIQEQNIEEKSNYVQNGNLDDIFDFLSQGTSKNVEESVDQTQTGQLNSIQNTSEALREIRAKRAHLNRSRRRKGVQKCDLELLFQFKGKGYWTKNFLQNCKKPHFDWLQKELGPDFLSQNPAIEAIKLRDGISMDQYLYLYSFQGLRDTWRKFFSTKYLHRAVILSRASDLSKEIFMKFHYRFEQAFMTGQFDHIA